MQSSTSKVLLLSLNSDLLAGGGESALLRILEVRPDVVGVTVRNVDNVDRLTPKTYLPEVFDLIRRIKQTISAPLVLGGSGYSLFPEEILRITEADAGVIGAGEQIIEGVIGALTGRETPQSTSDVLYRDAPANSSTRAIPKCPPGNLPRRDPDIFQYYLDQSGMANAQTQRGCPFRCAYCTYPKLEGRTLIAFPVEQVLDDLKGLARGGARYVFFADSVFNASRSHVLTLAERFIEEGLNIKWGAFFAPRGLRTEDFGLLKRAGLTHVEFGTDTLANDTCRSYDKSFSPEDVLEADEAAQKNELHVCHYLIFGGPGETMETAGETVSLALRFTHSVIMPYLGIRIFPGTEIARLAEEEGLILPGESLLDPKFYVSRSADPAALERMVRSMTAGRANWIFPDEFPKLQSRLQTLRGKGRIGPLWEFTPYRNTFLRLDGSS
ncbi:MAG: radical SAM protein [Deltaproteobacteria bacterium]|nr:radical SAM protein [Deltaproteobacteria bacterium]